MPEGLVFGVGFGFSLTWWIYACTSPPIFTGASRLMTTSCSFIRVQNHRPDYPRKRITIESDTRCSSVSVSLVGPSYALPNFGINRLVCKRRCDKGISGNQFMLGNWSDCWCKEVGATSGGSGLCYEIEQLVGEEFSLYALLNWIVTLPINALLQLRPACWVLPYWRTIWAFSVICFSNITEGVPTHLGQFCRKFLKS